MIVDIISGIENRKSLKGRNFPHNFGINMERETLIKAREVITQAANESYTKQHYGNESVQYLWYSKGIRDACWAIDKLLEECKE